MLSRIDVPCRYCGSFRDVQFHARLGFVCWVCVVNMNGPDADDDSPDNEEDRE